MVLSNRTWLRMETKSYSFITFFSPVLVTSRKLSENSLKTTEEKEELMKELRWHYKQFVRTSKKKKEKQVDVSKEVTNQVTFKPQT